MPELEPECRPNGLEVVDLVKSYRSAGRVVDGVSFRVNPGEVVGLLGPNGAGKSTSFNMVVGLVKPDAGKVLLGQNDISQAPIHMRARAGLAYLPQEKSIFRRLTVRDNLRAVLELRADLNNAQRKERIDYLISTYELEHVEQSLGQYLSGGERRRLEIARCLVMDPKIVLLDEPFAGVDPIAVRDLQTLIRQLAEQGLGVLITDHNVRETLGICDRAYILVAGKRLEHGDRQTIATSQKAKDVYLGDSFSL